MTHIRLSTAFAVAICVLCGRDPLAAERLPKENPRHAQQSFRFRYQVTITHLPPEKTVSIWIPMATSDPHQQVALRKTKLPGTYRTTKEKRYGNRMFYVEAKADRNGHVKIAIDYDITRKEVTPQDGKPLTDGERRLFLKPNRLVPLGGKPLELLPGKRLPGKSRAAVRSIYDLVGNHLRYDKPAGGKWGRGDAVWVCDSRFGNCSDFHSLFISLCRSSGVPARFQIGFPIPDKPKGLVGGYHCWAEFADGNRWFAVDLSEADKHPAMKDYYFGRLTPDRVAFSTGRDLILVPRQKSGPLNFFIHPHVEVDGKAHTKMRTRYAFERRDTSKPKR